MNRIVKKTIANVLAVVLFLSSIQGGQLVWAADGDTEMGYAVTRQMLSETNKGLGVEDRDSHSEETAMAQWDATAAGHYLLQYYIEANA